MRKNKTRTRLLSWLLTLSMLLSLLPGGVFAAGESDGAFVDAAVFFSDLHSTSSDSKTTMTTKVMGSIANGLSAAHPGKKVSAVFSVGDVFSSNEYQNSGSLSTITNNIVTGLGTVAPSADDVYYTWSDHDRNTEIENFTGLMYGADGNTNYYVYAISMSDMTSSTRYGVASTYKAEKLTAFTNTVKELDKTKPLFVATHVPLHDRRDDNQYGDEWYNVIYEAAKEMDVTVFWGHNHTSEPSSERELFFVEPGTKSFAVVMPVATLPPNSPMPTPAT